MQGQCRKDQKPWIWSPMSVSLMSGGVAGIAVEAILFPLDSPKTRAQSKQGFSNQLRLYRFRGSTLKMSRPHEAGTARTVRAGWGTVGTRGLEGEKDKYIYIYIYMYIDIYIYSIYMYTCWLLTWQATSVSLFAPFVPCSQKWSWVCSVQWPD